MPPHISTVFCTYILAYDEDFVKMNRLDKALNVTATYSDFHKTLYIKGIKRN